MTAVPVLVFFRFASLSRIKIAFIAQLPVSIDGGLGVVKERRDLGRRFEREDGFLPMRRTFVLHPWALGLLESRQNAGPSALRYFDSVLGVLRRAGFSAAMALRAFSVLDSYAFAEIVVDVALKPGFDFEKEFEFGLDLLLEALESVYVRFCFLAEPAGRIFLRSLALCPSGESIKLSWKACQIEFNRAEGGGKHADKPKSAGNPPDFAVEAVA